MERCIRKWISDGCDVILIDNGSTDETVPIARAFLGQGLLSIERLPWTGSFSLRDQLACKKQIAGQLDHDWIVHADADEWHCSPWGGSFAEAIRRVDAEGFNCIASDEMSFVAWPGEDFAKPGYERHMLTYYFLEPFKPFLWRAWRRDLDADNIPFGGHIFTAKAPLSHYPQHFNLRHYVALSQDHIYRKYTGRNFDPGEFATGWHHETPAGRDQFRLRPSRYLRQLSHWQSFDFDRTLPSPVFFWEWDDRDDPAAPKEIWRKGSDYQEEVVNFYRTWARAGAPDL